MKMYPKFRFLQKKLWAELMYFLLDCASPAPACQLKLISSSSSWQSCSVFNTFSNCPVGRYVRFGVPHGTEFGLGILLGSISDSKFCSKDAASKFCYLGFKF